MKSSGKGDYNDVKISELREIVRLAVSSVVTSSAASHWRCDEPMQL